MEVKNRIEKKLSISENCLKVLEKRYLLKDENGKIKETPEEMFRRVSRYIAKADKLYGAAGPEIKETENKFYEALSNFEFMPNSPTLMNAGKDLGQLSACFVLPVGDSMESIFDAIKNTAMIHKCLTADTLIKTSNGIKKLKDVKKDMEIETEEGYFPVKEVYNNGKQIIFEVNTNRGYSIKGTAEHKLLVVAENGEYMWREIGSIKPGDWVAMKPCNKLEGGNNKLPVFKYVSKPILNSGQFKTQKVDLPEKLTVELAELIGIYIGDGSNHRDGIRFSVGKDDREMVDIISGMSENIFNKKAIFSMTFSENYEVAILSTVIKQWFKFLGVTKSSSREARIPKIIFDTSEDIICAFLRGLFSTDGCIRESGHITLTTSSRLLSEEIQTLMLYIGIPTQRTYFKSTDSFQVSVCAKNGFMHFRAKIGFLLKRKNNRLMKVKISSIFKRGEVIPNQKAKIKEWYDGLENVSERYEARKFFDDIINRHTDQRKLTRQKVTAVVENSSTIPQFFKTILKEEYFFVKVSDVTPVGIMDTYDLTIPLKHSYLANGFISHNSGGGTGFSFSRLRPKNSVVRSTGGVSSGPVSFMKVFNAATQAVKQGGTRRGANMGILRVDHPDILEFIKCKENDKEITNFNISIAVTEDFMNKVINDEEYSLIDPHDKKEVKRLKAKEVFDLIVELSWKNGEPGIVFIDRINKDNPTPKLGEIESTNPCGEQPLLPFESCNLGSINLAKTICGNGAKQVDWDALRELVHTGVHFLDNVIDMNKFPLQEIEKMTRTNRKIGLGVMGWADMLIKLEIPYNSEEAVQLGEKIMKFIFDESRVKSRELAEKRGSFASFKESKFAEEGLKELRNATLTTIAPTGTISIISNTSSGVEPLFALSYYRNVMDNDKLIEVNSLFEEVAKQEGFYSRKLMEEIAAKGSIKDVEAVPEKYKKIFVTSHDIAPLWHIRMQAVFQKYTDNAVSKTVNFPHDAAKDDIREVYMLAFKLGCKGITIYRDKSREEQVLNINSNDTIKKEVSADSAVEPKDKKSVAPRPRPVVTNGTTTKVATGCGNLYITINVDDKALPFEVFIQMGKAGGCAASQLEAIGRLVSLALRSGVENSKIVEQLRGIRCPSPSWEKSGRIFSCSDAISRVLELRLGNGKMHHQEEALEKHSPHTMIEDKLGTVVGVCPDCGAALRHEEGCVVCRSCGYSKC
ncbi:MAG: ribonucleoside-diphosphate reductase, adenosylcobalamin-dependent [Candidatus Omnitrophica bacterium CG22_combo_CG10-13_8_21_14_all_43_16]|nr:MAG: ribonucleoside-diphosphate reductase, adenosylcobalamin-dependent [Candidatus Omnitrophica bacterium CG22_combo_CG10-13_8_21_14_all_43_16]